MRRFLPAAAGAKRLAESKFQGKHRQPYEPWDDDGMPAPGIGSTLWPKARSESV
jgi:hypothetical protein